MNSIQVCGSVFQGQIKGIFTIMPCFYGYFTAVYFIDQYVNEIGEKLILLNHFKNREMIVYFGPDLR